MAPLEIEPEQAEERIITNTALRWLLLPLAIIGSLKIVQEYERGVLFRLGPCHGGDTAGAIPDCARL